MNRRFPNALLISVLLLILCLFLNGCCTKQACGAAFGLFYDNRYAVERTGHLNYEKRVFAVDIAIETAHRWVVVDKWIWHTCVTNPDCPDSVENQRCSL